VTQLGAAQTLSDADFQKLRALVEGTLGIKMPATKKTMLESRILRRLRMLQLSSFREYVQYLESGRGDEISNFLDIATTNKTSFWRESEHFDALVQNALPVLCEHRERKGVRRLVAWSAASSTGQEPYCLAMVLGSFLERTRREDWDFEVVATDVSSRVLAEANRATYTEEDVEPLPPELKKRWLLRSKQRDLGLVRISKELRDRVRFRQLNLMSEQYEGIGQVDIIFCRNVFIYFDRPTQERVVRRLVKHLPPDGYLFMGMSESLHGLAVPVDMVGRSIYVRQTNAARTGEAP
jgi:chemotaxis protein methyltransferase CheR